MKLTSELKTESKIDMNSLKLKFGHFFLEYVVYQGRIILKNSDH